MGINYKQAILTIYKSLKIKSISDNETKLFYNMIKKDKFFKELRYDEFIYYNWDISKNKRKN